MANLADLTIGIGIDASELGAGLEDVGAKLDNHVGKIAAVGAAAGASMEGFARSQAPMNESLARMSAATGESSGALRDLAKSASNVTFPLDEVLQSMEAGRKQGLESGEQLQEFATFWDMVGDATGESGPALADAGIALRAVGIAAGDEAEALDALGFITQETTSSTQDFLKFLDRTGPELRDMGADVDDAAAIMGVLERELGMSGRTARQEFRSAITESDGTLEGMLDTLGVSADQFEEYSAKVGDSSDVIERNAAIHAESYTPMQKATHAAEELMFEYGALMDVAGSLAMPLMALGPAAKGVSLAMSGFGKVLPMVASGVRTLTTALLANPWVLVAAAIVALVVVVVKNWDTISAVIGAAWDWIKDKTSAVWGAISGALEAVWGAISGAVETVFGAIRTYFEVTLAVYRKVFETVWAAIEKVVDVAVTAVRTVIETTFGVVRTVIETTLRTVQTIVDTTLATIRNVWQGAWDAVTGALSTAWATVMSIITTKGGELLGWFGALPGSILGAIGDIASLLADKARGMVGGFLLAVGQKWLDVNLWLLGIAGRIIGAIGNLGSILLNAGRALMDGLLEGIKAGFGAVKDYVGGIAGTIASLKGPLPYDRRVLVDNGLALMFGLDAGMRSGLEGVLDTAADVAPSIADAIGAQPFDIGATLRPDAGVLEAGRASSSSSRTELDVLERIARAVESSELDVDALARGIGRETAREQQRRSRQGAMS